MSRLARSLVPALAALLLLTTHTSVRADDDDAPAASDDDAPAKAADDDAPAKAADDDAPAKAAEETAVPAEDTPDMPLATWRDADVKAFAIERRGAEGERLVPTWVDAEADVAAFTRAIKAAHALPDRSMPSDEALTAYVKLANGDIYDVQLLDVDHEGGWVELDDALLPVTAELAKAIAHGTGAAEFSSVSYKDHNTTDRDEPAPSLADLMLSLAAGARTHQTLVIWEDEPGDDGSEGYGENLAKEHDHVVSVGATEPTAMFKAIKAAADSNDACFDNVIVIAHGSPASIVLRHKRGATKASRVGYKADQLKPLDFGKALKPYLCGADPSIKLMTCRTALWVGGKQFLKDLAAGSGAVVTGADNYVAQYGRSTRIEVETPGSLWTATPKGGLSDVKQGKDNRWTHRPAATSED